MNECVTVCLSVCNSMCNSMLKEWYVTKNVGEELAIGGMQRESMVGFFDGWRQRSLVGDKKSSVLVVNIN